MADIIIQGRHCRVVLSEPDEDGDYGWTADCGATAESVQPLEDTIDHAERHADGPYTTGSAERHGS